MTPVLALSSGTIAAIVVIVVIDLFAIFFGMSVVRSRRAQQQQQAAATAAMLGEPVPPAPKPVSRRQFFRRSLVVSLLVFGTQFGGATLAFLWPRIRGFGSVINAGKLEDILAYISENDQPFYSGTGRFYIVRYNGRSEGDVDYQAEGVTTEGVMPLYQRCVHLGCRVPFCLQSQWFECPCHGSKYNTAGEYKLGPAPRGLDRFKVRVEGGDVLVDTAEIILGPPRGTDTLNRPIAGPFCVAVQ